MLENTESRQRAQRSSQRPRRVQVIVIGAGQAGLAAGDAWHRRECDFPDSRGGRSCRRCVAKPVGLAGFFTAAENCGIARASLPWRSECVPSKDELADDLKAYARHTSGSRYASIRPSTNGAYGDRYLITTSNAIFEAEHVVVATGSHQRPGPPRGLIPGARYRPDSVERLQESIATGSWWRARCRCRQQRRGACAGGGRGRSSRLALGPRCRPGAAVLPIRERTAVLVSRHTSLHDEDADRPQDSQGAAGRP